MLKTAILKFFAAFFYIATGALILFSLFLFSNPLIFISASTILFFHFLIFISLSLATFFIMKSCKTQARRNLILKISIFIVFIYYSLILLYLLFIDGRHHIPVSTNYNLYLKENISLIPFATIVRYINGFRYHTISKQYVAINLAGNVAAFLPMGIFLPVLFKPMKKAKIFFPTVTLGIAAVEVTQLLTLTGSCDIDDLILNMIGAAAGFGLIKLLSYKKVPYFY